MIISMKFVIFTIFAFVRIGYSAPYYGNKENLASLEETPSRNEEDPFNALPYLSEFGYLPDSGPNLKASMIVTNEALAKAIREFQKFMGLEQSGELNAETKKQMAKPRCGIKDFSSSDPNGPQSYTLSYSRWKRRTLSYNIVKYPSNFPREQTDRTIRQAFDVWSQVVPLRFVRRTRGPVHIEIKFASGWHGNCEPFRGPSGVLAHAADPLSGGDVHFDDSETWTINSPSGVNLLETAAHEFGHSLGLGHSRDPDALMFPNSRGYNPNFRLSRDDVTAIRRLYPR